MAGGGKGYKWVFKARFRKGAFGWRSRPAIGRIREAVSEIKKAARKDKILGAEGAVLFLERLSPSLERVDSSSGAIGSAVDRALGALVPIIGKAPAESSVRRDWLERLWKAYLEDDIPYLEGLADFWGELCGTAETAGEWADRFLPAVRRAWNEEPKGWRYCKEAVCCLSCLYTAGRYKEILELLELNASKSWWLHKYGVKALAALGRKAEAIRYAESLKVTALDEADRDRACEEILLSSGFVEEAYRRYGLEAARSSTYLGWFRAVARRYPEKDPEVILGDLAALTPGDEGKWFAAAKSAGLYDLALRFARRSPCDPRTLARAARDFRETEPDFAMEAGILALLWFEEGLGFEVEGKDIRDAFQFTLEAARRAGREEEAPQRIRSLLEAAGAGGLAGRVLGRARGLLLEKRRRDSREGPGAPPGRR